MAVAVATDPLQWTPELELALWRQMHAPKKKWIAGGACMYFRLNRHAGVKLYRDKEARNYAVQMQDKAHGLGLGPEVGSLFEFHFPDMLDGTWATDVKRRKMYGYVTQNASVKIGHASDREEMDRFCEEMEAAGFSAWDLAWINIGRINGKLVCIDFDVATHG